MSTPLTHRKVDSPDTTGDVLAAMLQENTGRSLCDSGGTPQYDAEGRYTGSRNGYGRAYEQNRGVNFEARPAVNFRVSVIEGCADGSTRMDFTISLDVYHWLKQRLTFDPKMDRRYQWFAKGRRGEESERDIMEAFPAALRDKDQHVTGLYGEEVETFSATNTYNGNDALSQYLQYVYFEVDGDGYVALQIHNGADVRGGYTDAKVFSLNEESNIFYNNRVTLIAYRPEDPNQGEFAFAREGRVDQVVWESENGGSSFSLEDGRSLYKGRGCVPTMHSDSVSLKGQDGFPFTTDPEKRGQGYVVLDAENQKLYCPVSGWELRPY